MTVKVTLTATQIIPIVDVKDSNLSPDQIGDRLAEEVQENPSKFVTDVRSKVEITTEVELTNEP